EPPPRGHEKQHASDRVEPLRREQTEEEPDGRERQDERPDRRPDVRFSRVPILGSLVARRAPEAEERQHRDQDEPAGSHEQEWSAFEFLVREGVDAARDREEQPEQQTDPSEDPHPVTAELTNT